MKATLANSMIFCTLLVLFCLSCKEEPPKDFVARVGDNYLYRDELRDLIPATSSREDSSRKAKVHINNWVREQVVLAKAKFNLKEDDDRFQNKIQNYLNELMVFEYENQLIRERLDTLLLEDDMKAYYEKNRANFILTDYVVRARFAIFESDVISRDFIPKFARYNEKDSLEVDLFCSENAMEFVDRSSEWMFFEDLLESVPLSISDKERFLKKNEFIDFKENGRHYLLRIEEYKLKDNVSPYELEREKIRLTLLNKRRFDMLEEMRNNLFSEAIQNGDIEIVSP